MSGGAIAALIAAGAFVLLVLLLAIPLLKLGRVLDEATLAIREHARGDRPAARRRQGTVAQVNGAARRRSRASPKNVNSMTTNVAALTSVVSSTLGSPLIKVAAFSYGVRKTRRRTRATPRPCATRRKHRARRSK